jgi:hypothetical protein
MKNLILTVCILCSIVILILIFKFKFKFNLLKLNVNAVDGKNYSVLNLPDKQIAANKLAKLNNVLFRIIEDLNAEHEHFNNDKFKRLKFKFKAHLTENAPGGRTTSYTLNKGDEIHMCLRQHDKELNLIDDNTLVFVALHELAHVMTISIGHTEEFWSNFKFLLNYAMKKGYYKYYPYHLKPKNYCGIKITSSP